ncbi:Zinc finger BED domain-containing protein DAYSLEEPER, partial [Bienertia sinuspersici]
MYSMHKVISFASVKNVVRDIMLKVDKEPSSTPSPSSRRLRSFPTQPDGGHVDVASDSFMMDFDNFSFDKFNVATKSDLIMYLEEPLIPRATNINILYHWKTNAMSGLESAFNTSDRVLDCYRSSLKPATAEAIICLKDWTFGE